MSAIIYLDEFNGTSGSEVPTSKQAAAIRFKSADDPVVDTSDPMVRPLGGVYRSVEKHLRINLSSLNGMTSVSNISIYTTGAQPSTGITIWSKTEAAYSTPLAGGYDASGAMIGVKTNIFDYTIDNPLVLAAGPYLADGVNVGDYLVLQMEAVPTADVGSVGDFSLVVSWDES